MPATRPTDSVTTIQLLLMAEPPERDVLLAAAGWAVHLAGELLVDGGRPGGGRKLLKLPVPSLDDARERSGWSDALRIERHAATVRLEQKNTDRHRLHVDAIAAAIQFASAARQWCASRTGCETILRAIRGAGRHHVLALLDKHDQRDRHDVDHAVAAELAVDAKQSAIIEARARLQSSRWGRATVMSRPLVDARNQEFADTLQAAASSSDLPLTATRQVHVGAQITLTVPLDLLARVDEATAAARGGVRRGDLIVDLIREGLGG